MQRRKWTINCIQYPVLLYAEILEAAGGQLDGTVEAVQRAEKAGAVKAEADQSLDYFFQLDGDDVAAGEIGIVENRADQAFGEEVLDEHFIDGRPADVRVQGGLAEGEEVVEGGLKALVALVGGGEDFHQSLGQLGDLGLKLIDGLMEVFDFRLDVGKELIQERGQLLLVGQIKTVSLLASLIEDRLPGVFENGVGQGIAFVDLLLDFGVEIVVRVLGFPEA